MIADISQGVWIDFMPGSGLLSKHYGVSVRTCIDALRIVEAANWIEPSQAGKPRRILAGNQQIRSETLLVVSSESTDLPALSHEIARQCAKLWLNAERGPVIHKNVDLGRLKDVSHLLEQWRERFPISRILIVGAPQQWVDFLLPYDLPVYFVGGELQGIDSKACSAVGVSGQSIFDAFFKAAKAGGYSQIAMASTSDLDRPNIKTALKAFNLTNGRKMVDSAGQILSFPINDPFSARRLWMRVFATERPKFVLIFNEMILVSFFAFCMDQGLKIGQDVNVFVVLSTSWLNENFFPSMTVLRVRRSSYQEHFKRWMKAPNPELGIKWLPLTQSHSE